MPFHPPRWPSPSPTGNSWYNLCATPQTGFPSTVKLLSGWRGSSWTGTNDPLRATFTSWQYSGLHATSTVMSRRRCYVIGPRGGVPGAVAGAPSVAAVGTLPGVGLRTQRDKLFGTSSLEARRRLRELGRSSLIIVTLIFSLFETA